MLIIRVNVLRVIDSLTEANYVFSKACSTHIHGSKTVGRGALMRRFDFPSASNKSKIQCSFIQ